MDFTLKSVKISNKGITVKWDEETHKDGGMITYPKEITNPEAPHADFTDAMELFKGLFFEWTNMTLPSHFADIVKAEKEDELWERDKQELEACKVVGIELKGGDEKPEKQKIRLTAEYHGTPIKTLWRLVYDDENVTLPEMIAALETECAALAIDGKVACTIVTNL